MRRRTTILLIAASAAVLVTGAFLRSLADELPELRPHPATLSALSFRVLDDQGQPLSSIDYSANLYAIDQPIDYRPTTRVKLQDGVWTIPAGDLQQGRIRFWVTADQGGNKAWSGYGEHSFDIQPTDAVNKSRPTDVVLKPAELLVGRVVAQDSGKSIAGAEVAPSTFGHHSTWVDWDQAVRSGPDGNFRIVASYADGVAAKHSDFAEKEIVFDYGRQMQAPLSIALSRKRLMRGRVVDQQGEPIEGVRIGDETSNDEGRFKLSASADQWRSKKNEVALHADGYEYASIAMRKFDLNGRDELVIELEEKQQIGGQIVNRDGSVSRRCQLQIGKQFKYGSTNYSTPIDVVDGQWQAFIDEGTQRVWLRVLVDGKVVCQRETLRPEWSKPIRIELPVGHTLHGSLSRCPQADRPYIVLRDAENQVVRVEKPTDAGTFALDGIVDGQYRLQLYPAHLELHCSMMYDAEPPYEFLDPHDERIWSKVVHVAGDDVDLWKIRLAGKSLLPGKVQGVAVDPKLPGVAFANGFVYLANSLEQWDTAGSVYYIRRVMTDSAGRFVIDPCPPGKYFLAIGQRPDGFLDKPHAEIHVRSGKTSQVVVQN